MSTVEKGLVLSNRQLYKDMYEMEFEAANIASKCAPGQFVHIITGPGYDPLLRRPISLYDVNKDAGTISLLYKVVGKGTDLLSKVAANDFINVMGPLGKGFSIPGKAQRTLLVGGGVGIAPLVYLARELKRNHNEVTVLYGCNDYLETVAKERLLDIGVKLLTAAQQGQSDYKGLLTADLCSNDIKPDDIDFLYTCGPEAMMASWAAFSRQNGISGEVSLEEHMACGVGACLGCARKLKKTDQNYVKVCKDGPVFAIEQLE